MEGQLCRLRGQDLKTDLSEQIEPKFSCEHTMDKEMVNSLFFLVTERTIFRMRQPTTCQAISRPTPVVRDQPHKEATLRRCPRFPDPRTIRMPRMLQYMYRTSIYRLRDEKFQGIGRQRNWLNIKRRDVSKRIYTFSG